MRPATYPLELRYFSIPLGVALAHTVTAACILLGGLPTLLTTPLSTLSYLVGNPYWIAAILIATSILAAIPYFSMHGTRLRFMLLVAPQQILLLFHLIAVITAIYVGHYADGYVPVGGSFFIATDQVWLLSVILFHTLEYSEVI